MSFPSFSNVEPRTLEPPSSNFMIEYMRKRTDDYSEDNIQFGFEKHVWLKYIKSSLAAHRLNDNFVTNMIITQPVQGSEQEMSSKLENLDLMSRR